jgi:D-threo-aldose 1-dehydrogenase
MGATPLAARALGRSGLRLTEIGFGAGPLGGFYGPVTAEDAVQAVNAAWGAGIRYFDVAPLYGHGRAELLLGHVLREKPRDEFVLSTKIGRYLVPARGGDDARAIRAGGLPFVPILDYSRDGVERSLEQSLQRLGLSRIDIVLIHDVDAHAQGSVEAAERAFRAATEGALPALGEMKRAGHVRAIGIGVNQVEWALRWLDAADLDCVMIAGRCTLLNREALPRLLPACASRGIGVLAAGAFNGGLLAQRHRGIQDPAPHYNYRPAPAEVLARLAALEDLAARTGTELAAAAIRFVLRQQAVSSLVVGAMSAAEVLQNVAALHTAIPDGFWSEVERT